MTREGRWSALTRRDAAISVPLRQDYEYRREGVRNLFLACWRHVAVTQRRTMEDFAQQMRWLVDEAYPEVEVVRVVLDNLNTHRMASLYERSRQRRPGGLPNGWSSKVG